jgi:hypothetical protein
LLSDSTTRTPCAVRNQTITIADPHPTDKTPAAEMYPTEHQDSRLGARA